MLLCCALAVQDSQALRIITAGIPAADLLRGFQLYFRTALPGALEDDTKTTCKRRNNQHGTYQPQGRA
jgi:hypothetical protein